MTKLSKQEVSFVGRPVWAEVSKSALTENLRSIKKFVNPPSEKRKSPRMVLSIVKGNAYGHGSPDSARILEKAGSDWFGVASVGEGIELRKGGVRKPILVLAGFWPGEEKLILQHKLVPAVHRCEQIRLLERAAARAGKRHVEFHLKIDTGMNRLGILPSDVECFAKGFAKCHRLYMGGVFTHFSASESVGDTPQGRQTLLQTERFDEAVNRLRQLGVEPGLLHLANSAAISLYPDTWADMVRPGAILYGYHPGYEPVELRPQIEAQLPLQPVMSLRTRIMNLRRVPAGMGVGYGASWVAQRPSRIGVLAAGYGDGVHRSLGNRGHFIICGKAAPITGIISMDVTMVDVTDIPEAELGEVATLYGTVGDKCYPANLIARGLGTVTSDLLCGVSRRVPRFYVSK